MCLSTPAPARWPGLMEMGCNHWLPPCSQLCLHPSRNTPFHHTRGHGKSPPGKFQASQYTFLNFFSRTLQFLASRSDLFGAHHSFMFLISSQDPRCCPPHSSPAQCWVPPLLQGSVTFSQTTACVTILCGILTSRRSASFLHSPLLSPFCPQISFFKTSANASGTGSVLRTGDCPSVLPHTCTTGVGCFHSTHMNGELTMYWAPWIGHRARQP